MQSAFKLIRMLDSQKLPWIFEHPHTSKAWYLPELRRLQGQSHVQTIVTDFCQWGTKWRKRTCFLLGNIELSLARILQGNPSRWLLKPTLIVFVIGLFVQHLPSTCLFRSMTLPTLPDPSQLRLGSHQLGKEGGALCRSSDFKRRC